MSAELVARFRPGATASAAAAPVREELLDAAPARPHLWALADLRRLVRALALSGTGLVLAWLVASGTTDPARQEYAVAGGVVATAVALAGLTGWLLAGTRAVRVRRYAEMQDVRALLARRAPETQVASPAGALVTVAGATHWHDSDCLMVRGKDVRPVRTAERGALLPCPVCLPREAP
jgi:hypothetical protein